MCGNIRYTIFLRSLTLAASNLGCYGYTLATFFITRERTEVSIFRAIYQVHVVKCAKSMELRSHNHKFSHKKKSITVEPEQMAP